ncbi:MAG: hypothetical protein HKO07_09070, partial [Pseudomonadales bacterium]|nr:hypothetical protein [Pseudomonadales bacterium]
MQDNHEGAQRFYARDMGAAMKMLSDAFGADALLLSSRRVGNGVEIVGLPPGDARRRDVHSRDGTSRDGKPGDASERRRSDRRRSDRRSAGAARAATSASLGGAGNAAPFKQDASPFQQDAPQRKQFGDTLAQLSSEHAALFE